MKQFLRFFSGFIVVVIGVITFFLWQSEAMEKRDSFAAIKKEFKGRGITLSEHFLTLEEGVFYYVQIGDASLPPLVLIHGSPGDWTAWKQFVLTTEITQHFHLIIPDRPAYQASTVKGGSLARQSEAFSTLMEEHCHPCTLVGHSFGGALALQLSIDYPENTASVISLAGTVAAPFQTPKWYNYLGEKNMIQSLLTNGFLASNDEMMQLSEDLAILEPQLVESKHSYHFLQGGNDILVNPSSPFYLLPLLNNVGIKYYSEWDHFVIWTAKTEVSQFIQSISP